MNYLHIAPRKIRLVSDLIKGMDVKEAQIQLKFMPQRVSAPLLTLISSAIANAENNLKLDKAGLYIKTIMVNEGTPFKRWQPVSRGRAFPILKRTSCVNLVLGIKEGFEAKKIKETKKETKKETIVPKETTAKEVKETKEEIKPVTEKIKYKAPQEIKKVSKFKGLTKKIFRRKSF